MKVEMDDEKEGDEEENLAEQEEDIAVHKLISWHIIVHVHGKEFRISAGDGTQRVKWLGHVGIARWDEEGLQGWKRLGIPTAVKLKDASGVSLDLAAVIREVMQNGDHVFVETSLAPNETET